MKDYYKILGVEKTASKDEIKKAFRKLAHEHHPDKNKNDPASAQRFKEASEAYSVLSDDNKRKQFDMFGSAGPGAGGPGGYGGQGGQGNPFGGFDFSGFQNGQGGIEFDLGDLFGDFFGGGRGTARQPKGHDISIDLLISFEESVFGAEKDLIVSKTSKCLTCEGSGASPGSGMDTCTKCNGKGKINETRRSFIGVFTSTRVCDNCHGKGQVPKVKCPTCKGDGVIDRQQEISVAIPAGIEDGEMMRLNGMGEAIPNGISGDLYVRIHVKPHPTFKKKGSDLVMDLKIKLTTAITGGDVTVKTLDGDVVLKIPEGTNNGDVLRIKGKGVATDRKRGDILVRIAIEMPKRLSKSAKQAIEELKKEGI